jgi:hypothetical protein
MEAGTVFEPLYSLVFGIPEDGKNPKTQLYTTIRTL